MYEVLINDLHLEKARVRGNEIHCACPWASLTHMSGRDNNPSFSLNVEKGVYNCFTCGKRGVIEDLIEWILGLSLFETLEFLEDRGFSRLEIALQSLEREQYLPSGEKDYFIPEAILEPFECLDKHNEIYKGEVDGNECIIYVVRNYLGAIVGGEARSIEGRWHKVLWSMEKSHYLYGENFVSQRDCVDYYLPLTIVEGAGDCVCVRKAMGMTEVVALFGAYASDTQINKLLRLSDSFVIWLDNDSAGWKGVSRLFKELEPRATEVRYVSPYDLPVCTDQDPKGIYTEFGWEKVQEIIYGAKSYLELQNEIER